MYHFHPPLIDTLIPDILDIHAAESWIWLVIGALAICVIQRRLTGFQATRAW